MTGLRLEQVALMADGRRLFRPLSAIIGPSELVVLIGPSGIGKSSLLSYMCGVLPPALSASGRVFLDERDLAGVRPESRGLGILFQQDLLFPHLSVAGNLLFGLRGRERDRHMRRQQVEAALESVGLGELGTRDPATLSGGQRARIALLRVMLAEPRALLLDEPFTGLDPVARSSVRELVFAEARRRRLPTLMVTHDAEDIEAAGGRVIRLAAD